MVIGTFSFNTASSIVFGAGSAARLAAIAAAPSLDTDFASGEVIRFDRDAVTHQRNGQHVQAPNVSGGAFCS